MLLTKRERMPGGSTAGLYGTASGAFVAVDCWPRALAAIAAGARTAARPCINRRRVTFRIAPSLVTHRDDGVVARFAVKRK